jgi:hypothetical protein
MLFARLNIEIIMQVPLCILGPPKKVPLHTQATQVCRPNEHSDRHLADSKKDILWWSCLGILTG